MLHIELPENLQNFDPNVVTVKIDEQLQIALQTGITRYNEKALSNVQRVQYFTVLPHDFSIATGELGKERRPNNLFKLIVKNNIILQVQL